MIRHSEAITHVVLHSARLRGHEIEFRWDVQPKSSLYRRTQATIKLPKSLDTGALTQGFLDRSALLLLHSHFSLLGTCVVQLPFRLREAERRTWMRLLTLQAHTLQAHAGQSLQAPNIRLIDGSDSAPLTACTGEERANARVATAFSGGKDSLLQQALLRDLGQTPILVSTTDSLPGEHIHANRRRRAALDFFANNFPDTLLEVESDFRSCFDNEFPQKAGLSCGVNELSDTLTYLTNLFVVARCLGVSRCFFASETEVQENAELGGAIIEHPHRMYSTVTLAAISSIFKPAGIAVFSTTSALHQWQIQTLLATRYRTVAPLQFSCYSANDDTGACSACPQCLRLAWTAMAAGAAPSDQGVDLIKLLHAQRYWSPGVRGGWLPGDRVDRILGDQAIRTIKSTSWRQLTTQIFAADSNSAGPIDRLKALAGAVRIALRLMRFEANAGQPGFREGFLADAPEDLRAGLRGIFAAHFEAEPLGDYRDVLDRHTRLVQQVSDATLLTAVTRTLLAPAQDAVLHHPSAPASAPASAQPSSQYPESPSQLRSDLHSEGLPAWDILPAPEPALRRVALPDGTTGSIPVSMPAIGDKEKARIHATLEANWISSAGPVVREFEQRFAEAVGCEFGVACSSGTAALHLALAALGLGPGDEVILPTFTMVATANAVTYCGARPVLVDCTPDTWNMDVHAIEDRITAQTRAIIVVHIYGHPVDMAPVQALARRHGLWVVEDAAEAHGAHYRGQPVGSLGDVATFSMYANKNLTTGEGGVVTTNNPEIARRAQTLRDQAFSPERHFWHRYRGFNYRMTSMQAAVGLAQTERFAELIEARCALARRYAERLSHLPGLTLPVERAEVMNVYWMFGVVVQNAFGISRDMLRMQLAEKGIETRCFFIPMHRQPIYAPDFVDQRFPVADELCRRGLYLPTFAGLGEGEVDYICGAMAHARAGESPTRWLPA